MYMFYLRAFQFHDQKSSIFKFNLLFKRVSIRDEGNNFSFLFEIRRAIKKSFFKTVHRFTLCLIVIIIYIFINEK